jgi:hypothetical protein
MSNIPQQWLYYAIGLLLLALGGIVAGIMLVWNFILPGFIVGGTISGIGYYLFSLGDKLRQKSRRLHPAQDMTDANNRDISTGGGTYNEKIQGDVINIQGNKIYLGQDLSQITDQIKQILNQLQNQGHDAAAAEKQVINDLKIQMHRNSRIRTKLLKGNKQLEMPTANLLNDAELAEEVVKFAREKSFNFSGNSIFVIEGKYKKLYDLLEAGKWQEADEETVEVIRSLMPDCDYTYVDVDQIPPKELRRINQLWVKFSNGRFGFSVQQSIWRKILKAYHSNRNESWELLIDDSTYIAFIDRVGWSRESNRIYHTELEYSLKAPKGHLPARSMFKKPSYPYRSNYYYFNQSIFDELMEREYYKISFIPSWLENWLLSE